MGSLPSPHRAPGTVPARAAVGYLRAECVRCREVLSHQPETAIRVELPEMRTELSLSRTRFESLARTHLERVPELLLQAVQSASMTPDQLDAVVLAGGTV